MENDSDISNKGITPFHQSHPLKPHSTPVKPKTPQKLMRLTSSAIKRATGSTPTFRSPGSPETPIRPNPRLLLARHVSESHRSDRSKAGFFGPDHSFEDDAPPDPIQTQQTSKSAEPVFVLVGEAGQVQRREREGKSALEAIIESAGIGKVDISSIDDETRLILGFILQEKPAKALTLLKSYAKNVSVEASIVACIVKAEAETLTVSDLCSTGSTEVTVWLSYEARKAHEFTVGTVVLLDNPRVVSHNILRVEEKDRILIVGQCTDFATCANTGCSKPIRKDRDGQYCWSHSLSASIGYSVRSNTKGGLLDAGRSNSFQPKPPRSAHQPLIPMKPQTVNLNQSVMRKMLDNAADKNRVDYKRKSPEEEAKEVKAREIQAKRLRALENLEAKKQAALWLQERNGVRASDIHAFSFSRLVGDNDENAGKAEMQFRRHVKTKDNCDLEIDFEDDATFTLPPLKPVAVTSGFKEMSHVEISKAASTAAAESSKLTKTKSQPKADNKPEIDKSKFELNPETREALRERKSMFAVLDTQETVSATALQNDPAMTRPQESNEPMHHDEKPSATALASAATATQAQPKPLDQDDPFGEMLPEEDFE